MTTQEKYTLSYVEIVKRKQLVREMTKGRICKNKDHKHILANTFECLESETV